MVHRCATKQASNKGTAVPQRLSPPAGEKANSWIWRSQVPGICKRGAGQGHQLFRRGSATDSQFAASPLPSPPLQGGGRPALGKGSAEDSAPHPPLDGKGYGGAWFRHRAGTNTPPLPRTPPLPYPPAEARLTPQERQQEPGKPPMAGAPKTRASPAVDAGCRNFAPRRRAG